jgi:hypothetical protein
MSRLYYYGDDHRLNTWICDRWIWKMQDGSLKAVTDQRIPAGAVTLFAGRGTRLPEALAKEQGWIKEVEE